MIELNKIYNENCLDTMKRIDDKYIDLILTDPPYGIGLEYDSYDDTSENWFDLMKNVIPQMIRISKMVIMPVCKIVNMKWFYQYFPPDWLICWYKGSPGQRSFIGFNDWEPHIVYGKTNNLCMHDYFQTISSPDKGFLGHPCPKPIEWANWLILKSTKPGDIIYDPFIGSGTVAISAIENGRKYIGSEISKKYCDIIKNRINNTSDSMFFL